MIQYSARQRLPPAKPRILLATPPPLCLQSSYKLQVVLVCDEALTRITYQARTVEVQPLLPAAAHATVKAAQPSVSEVRGVTRLE